MFTTYLCFTSRSKVRTWVFLCSEMCVLPCQEEIHVGIILQLVGFTIDKHVKMFVIAYIESLPTA